MCLPFTKSEKTSVVTARKLLKVDLKREPTQMLGFALNYFVGDFQMP